MHRDLFSAAREVGMGYESTYVVLHTLLDEEVVEPQILVLKKTIEGVEEYKYSGSRRYKSSQRFTRSQAARSKSH